MTFQEKYDLIIEQIERNLEKKYVEIGDIISDMLLMSKRNIFEIFKFISDYTFAEYIGQRRLARIYQLKKESDCSWDEAAYDYGEDYTSYYRRFKNTFNMSPAEALKSDMKIHFLPPLYFKEIVTNRYKAENTMLEEKRVESLLHITAEQYRALDEIQSYQALYGFENEEIIELFNLSSRYKLKLSDLCECRKIESLFEDFLVPRHSYLPEHLVKRTAKLVHEHGYDCETVYWLVRENHCEEFIHLVMKNEISEEDAQQFETDMENCGYDWEDISDELVQLYFSKANRYFYVGDVLSIYGCKRVMDMAAKVGVDVLADTEMLMDFIDLEDDDFDLKLSLKRYQECYEFLC